MNRKSGRQLAEMKSNLLKKETSGLWWIVHQIENPSSVIGYLQRNQMEDIKPVSLPRASHKYMVKTTMKPSQQSHALRQYDCFWLMCVKMTGTLKA